MIYNYALGLNRYKPEFNANRGFIQNSQQRMIIGIKDFSFEQLCSSWELQTWKGTSKVSIDSNIAHSGGKSLKITGGSGENWKSVGIGFQNNIDFILKPGYQYKLSAWVKTKNVRNAVFVRIKIQYSNRKARYLQTPTVYGTKEWSYVETEFNIKAGNTVEYLGALLIGMGTAWFDDISLEVMSSK